MEWGNLRKMLRAIGFLCLSLAWPLFSRAEEAAPVPTPAATTPAPLPTPSSPPPTTPHPGLQDLVGQPAPDLHLVLRDGTTRALSDSRGRWVFVEEGATWCPPSQDLAITLSEIQDQLHDQPFDFVYIYDEPSFDDVDLGSYFKFSGTQALNDKGLPGEWNLGGPIPACFLIDPSGKVVWAGRSLPADKVRAELMRQASNEIHFPPDFATVSPYRAEQEKAILLAFQGNNAASLPLFLDLSAQNPNDPANRAWYAECLSQVKSHAEAADWLGNELKDPSHANDALSFYQADHLLNAWKFSDAAAALAPLVAKYPQAIGARALQLICTKSPDEATPDDLELLMKAASSHAEFAVSYFTAFAAESAGWNDEARRLFAQMDSGWQSEMRAGYLARLGRLAEARRLVTALDGGLTPQTATRETAWEAMFRHLTALDWRGATDYAAIHTKTTPWNAGGAVIRLLAAVRTGDAEAKSAAWQELLAFKTDRQAYLFGQKVMSGQVTVTEDDVQTYADDKYGFIGLLWASAALEALGRDDQARQVDTWLMKRENFSKRSYWNLFSLRATIGKFEEEAPAPVATPPVPKPSHPFYPIGGIILGLIAGLVLARFWSRPGTAPPLSAPHPPRPRPGSDGTLFPPETRPALAEDRWQTGGTPSTPLPLPFLAKTGPTLVEIRNLTKSYGAFQAIDDLTLSVAGGQIFAFLGPNGAGKTTTIRMLMGILVPTSGTARIGGLDCFRDRVAVKRQVGYLPDEPIFYDYLRGGELIRFSGEMHGLDALETERRVRPLIERFELDDALNEFAVNYSTGMKKKLALVCAMIHDPALLILDEPTNGLDPFATRVLHEVIREKAAEGKTVFFSTHLLDQAERLCTDIGIVAKGRLVAHGTLSELRGRASGDASLEEIFFSVAGDRLKPPAP